MPLLIVVVVLTQLVTVAAVAAFVLGHRSLFEQLLAAKQAELERALTRIAFLENTIDEVRARELSTTPPAAAEEKHELKPLPEKIQEQLELVEDPDGEIEALVRYQLEVEGRSEEQVLGEVFG